MDITLTRAEFDRLTADLVERTVIPGTECSERCRTERFGAEQGSAGRRIHCMLAVQEKVKALTGKEPSKALNPDECA